VRRNPLEACNDSPASLVFAGTLLSEKLSELDQI
jgi:hypothetical protein